MSDWAQLYDLRPVQNENTGPLVKHLLRVQAGANRALNQAWGPSKKGPVGVHRSHTHVHPASDA